MPDLARTFEDLLGRLDGPLHFRLIFQPLMATLFAIRDGSRDARAGRKPFRLMTDPAQRRQALLTGWRSVGKVFVIAFILDAVYQFRVFGWFYLVACDASRSTKDTPRASRARQGHKSKAGSI